MGIGGLTSCACALKSARSWSKCAFPLSLVLRGRPSTTGSTASVGLLWSHFTLPVGHWRRSAAYAKEWGLYLTIIFTFRAAVCQVTSGQVVLAWNRASTPKPMPQDRLWMSTTSNSDWFCYCSSMCMWFMRWFCVYADAPWVWQINEPLNLWTFEPHPGSGNSLDARDNQITQLARWCSLAKATEVSSLWGYYC